MRSSRALAMQAKAAQEQAEKVSSLEIRLKSIEAKLDLLLGLQPGKAETEKDWGDEAKKDLLPEPQLGEKGTEAKKGKGNREKAETGGKAEKAEESKNEMEREG